MKQFLWRKCFCYKRSNTWMILNTALVICGKRGIKTHLCKRFLCVCVWKKHVIASNWVNSANWFTLALLFRLSKSFSTIPGEPDTTNQSQITVLLSCGHSLSALKILEPYWARWESNIWQILTAGKKTKLTFVKFPTVLASPHPSL